MNRTKVPLNILHFLDILSLREKSHLIEINI